MPNSVQLTMTDRRLHIVSAHAFSALVLAFDEDGNGAYVNCDVTAGETVLPSPLSGRHVTFEVMDAEGSLRGQLAS